MKYLATLAVCFAASSASAQSCRGDDQTVIPEMEAAKAAFLAGDYPEFVEILGDDITALRSQVDTLFGPLEEAIGGPFSACATVVQRHEAPGFYQDVVAFEHPSFDAPLYLFLQGVRVGDTFRFTRFLYDDTPSVVFDNLR